MDRVSPDPLDTSGNGAPAFRLVLVHGTGAGTPGPSGDEKWWQPESAFAQGLIARLSGEKENGPLVAAEAFIWSGDNSERERRMAGRMLAQKLAALEREAIPYHLIGHSHGGSVIWHGLKQAAAHGNALTHLAGWITIGTPFLTFSPRNRWYLLFAALALALALTAALFLLTVPSDLLAQGHFAPWATGAIWAGLAALAGLVLLAGLDLLTQLRLRWRSAAGTLPDALGKRLAQSWLGIAHDLDEPINGLAASLSGPPEIAPRSWRPRSGTQEATAEGLLSRWRRFIALPYDSLIAPLIDQFVWDTGIARLQGRDVAGTVMTECRTRPAPFAIAWPPLPEALQAALAQKADAAASQSAAAFRAELKKISAGEAPAERIAQAISWNEVIHTTYFAQEQILDLAARFIATRGDATRPAGNDDETARWIATGPRPAAPVTRHFEPFRLYLARLAGIALIAGTLSFALSAAHRAWLLPYTNRFQIALITENISRPQFTRLWESPTAGKVLIRLVALGESERVFQSLGNIRHPNTRIMAAELAAFGFGFYGEQTSLERTVRDFAKSDSGATNANPAIVLKTYGLAGAQASGAALKATLAADLETALLTPDGLYSFGPGGPVDLAATLLLANGRTGAIDRLVSEMTIDCKKTLDWLAKSGYAPTTPAVRGEVETCAREQSGNSAENTTPEETTAQPASGTQEAGAGAPPSPYETARRISVLAAKNDYAAVAQVISSWDEKTAREVVGAMHHDEWIKIAAGLDANSFAPAARRIGDLVESDLQGRLGESLSETYAIGQAEIFAEAMLALKRREALARHARALDEESQKDDFLGARTAAQAGILHFALGDIPAWRASFGRAIEQAAKLSESAFPFVMRLAEKATETDRTVALAALAQATNLIEEAFAIDSVPDYSYSLTDISRLYARLGEYRLARDVAEQVGQRLAETPGGQVTSRETEGDPAREKDSLRGGGVLGGYIAILDAEIRRALPERASLLDMIDQWPEPSPLFLTSFNRG